MNKFHDSVKPCENYGNCGCYACKCAWSASGVTNGVALELQCLGYLPFIEQVGGMCMLGILDMGKFWIGFNDECIYVYENNYFDSVGEDADDSARALTFRDFDVETDSDFIARSLTVILGELKIRKVLV